MPASADGAPADPLGGSSQARDGGGDGVVADAVEARLDTGAGAQNQGLGDRRIAQVADAPAGSVGIGLPQRGRAGADRTVHAEIAGQPDRADGPGALQG